MVGLDPIPAVTERESGYTLEISPVCQHIETDNHFFGLWEMLEKNWRETTQTRDEDTNSNSKVMKLKWCTETHTCCLQSPHVLSLWVTHSINPCYLTCVLHLSGIIISVVVLICAVSVHARRDLVLPCELRAGDVCSRVSIFLYWFTVASLWFTSVANQGLEHMAF